MTVSSKILARLNSRIKNLIKTSDMDTDNYRTRVSDHLFLRPNHRTHTYILSGLSEMTQNLLIIIQNIVWYALDQSKNCSRQILEKKIVCPRRWKNHHFLPTNISLGKTRSLNIGVLPWIFTSWKSFQETDQYVELCYTWNELPWQVAALAMLQASSSRLFAFFSISILWLFKYFRKLILWQFYSYFML